MELQKLTEEQFAMICFLVLMQNGNGLEDKAPIYVEEKSKMLTMGYNAFGELDAPNMESVMFWMEMWRVEVPPQIRQRWNEVRPFSGPWSDIQ